MGGLDLSKKLWRIPQQGMVKGVCAGIAQYLDVPVKLVRLITVLAMIFGLFLFVVVAYIILSFALDPMPESELYGEKTPSSGELLAAAAGVAGWAVKSVARRPLKMLLMLVLEPMLSRAAQRFSKRRGWRML